MGFGVFNSYCKLEVTRPVLGLLRCKHCSQMPTSPYHIGLSGSGLKGLNAAALRQAACSIILNDLVFNNESTLMR